MQHVTGKGEALYCYEEGKGNDIVHAKIKNTCMELKWYAVYTKLCWEKKVAQQLSNQRIENYCPLNRVVRQWSDRKKVVHEPLFTSYVFIRVMPRQFADVKKITGVINLVYWLNQPGIIQDHEIETIRKFLGEYQNVRLEKMPVNVHDIIRITSGPLAECEGSVVAVNTNTIKVMLPSLGCIMAAEVERANVEVINQPAVFPPEKGHYRFAFK